MLPETDSEAAKGSTGLGSSHLLWKIRFPLERLRVSCQASQKMPTLKTAVTPTPGGVQSPTQFPDSTDDSFLKTRKDVKGHTHLVVTEVSGEDWELRRLVPARIHASHDIAMPPSGKGGRRKCYESVHEELDLEQTEICSMQKPLLLDQNPWLQPVEFSPGAHVVVDNCPSVPSYIQLIVFLFPPTVVFKHYSQYTQAPTYYPFRFMGC